MDTLSTNSPTVTTDLLDYAPGSTATITAENFIIGSTLEFQVLHVIDAGDDGVYGTLDDVIGDNSGDGHESWHVTDGGEGDLDGVADGNIVTSWFVNPDDSIGATFLLTATGAGADNSFGSEDDLIATAAFTDAAPLLEAYRNISNTWGNSPTVQQTNALYAEGDVIPFRYTQAATGNPSTQLQEGVNYTIRLEWDFSDGASARFIDYLDDYDVSEAGGTNLTPLFPFGAPTSSVAIPTDPELPVGVQQPGLFQLYNIDDTSVTYVIQEGLSDPYGEAVINANQTRKFIEIQFTPDDGDGTADELVDVGIAWGGHLATQTAFGLGNGAGEFPGASPQFLIELLPHENPFDSALNINANAVVPKGRITIIKDADPNDPQDFSFTSNVPGFSTFTLDDDGDNTNTLSNQITFLDLAPGTYTFTEDGELNWSLVSITPTENGAEDTTTGDISSVNLGTNSITITLADGEIWTVEFDNTFVPPAGAPGLTKVANVDFVDAAGDVINYQIVASNSVGSPFTSVAVTDQVESYASTSATFVSGDTDTDGQLDAGEAWTYSASYTVTQDDIDGRGGGDDDIDNTATGVFIDAIPGADTLTASEAVSIVYNPSIVVTKTADVSDVDAANDVINYTITVDNAGNVALNDTAVTDTLDASVTLASGDTDTDGLLDVNETWTYNASYTVTQDDIDSQGATADSGGSDGFIDNTATAVFTDPTTTAVTDSASEAVSIVYNPSLTVAKEMVSITDEDGGDGGTTADEEGDVIHYTITVANAGNVSLTNVEVNDSLLGGPLSGPDSGDSDTDGVLDVGETWTYSADYTVAQSDIDEIGHLQWQNSGEEAPFQVGDTWFVQGSDYPATGSGVIDSFVRLQAQNEEEGYNTDFRPQQFDEGNTPTFNHSILVADVPVVLIDGEEYWEFRIDLNEHDGNSDRDVIFLEQLMLFSGEFPDLTGFNGTSGSEGFSNGDSQLLFRLDPLDPVQLDEWTSGSGHGDYTVLIPKLDDADFEYMYLYSKFSDTDGGFEEWYVRKFGLLENTATVTTDERAGGSATEDVVVSAAADYGIVATSAILAASTTSGDATSTDITKEGTVTGDNAIEYTVTVQNNGNVTLGNVLVTDQVEGGSLITLNNFDSELNTFSGDDDSDGRLGLNETWTYTYTRQYGEDAFDVDGDAQLTNTATVDSEETHPLSGSSVVDVSSMIFIGVDAHAASWWATHLAAWDGNLSTNAWDSLVGSDLSMRDVLIAVDSNRNGSITPSDAKGILLGDDNANGLSDGGETTLFIPLAAAQQLINASDAATDMRLIMMKEAIAAQLNINNMSGDSTSTLNPEGPNDIVSEAAMWLRGLDPYTYGTNSTSKVDTNGNGILSVGNSNSFEYNTGTKAFTADANPSVAGRQALSSNLDAWLKDVDVDLTWANIQASGQDLKDGLQDFNAGSLIVDPHGNYLAAYDTVNDMVVVDSVQPNSPDAFWSVLSDYII